MYSFGWMLLPIALAAAALLPGWTQIGAGPDGGTVWQGYIPGNHAISAVYLPPAFSPNEQYPLLVVLHGFPGDAWSLTNGLRFARIADPAIESGRVEPFIAVMPTSAWWALEWAGHWEHWIVDRVLPWAEQTLPVSGDRALAGLSAGGYGAVDIGLRHPGLFGTLEAWSGYFRPYADGPLTGAPRAVLAAHDPTMLVAREADLLRRLGTRIYLSCGDTDDDATLHATLDFERVVADLGLPHELRLYPGGHDGRFWRRQLPAALAYAFPA